MADLGWQQRVEAKHVEEAFGAVSNNLERVGNGNQEPLPKSFTEKRAIANGTSNLPRKEHKRGQKDYLLTTEITEEHTCRAGFDTAEQAGDEQGSVPENSDLRAGESFVCSGEQQHEWRGAQGVGFISSEGTGASALESAGTLRRRAPCGAHANGRRSTG